MRNFLHKYLFVPFKDDSIDDHDRPVVIACPGDTHLSVDRLASEAMNVQASFGLDPFVEIHGLRVRLYSDPVECIDIWTEGPAYLRSFLTPDKYRQLGSVPSSCILLEYCNYEKGTLPEEFPKTRRWEEDPDLAEQLWDRLIWRYMELHGELLIIHDEGVRDKKHAKVLDWS